jgi:hypothetical protein
LVEIRLKSVELAQFNFRHGIHPNRRRKKSTMGRISAKLDDIRPKSVAEIQLRAFDRFSTNFGQKIITVSVLGILEY